MAHGHSPQLDAVSLSEIFESFDFKRAILSTVSDAGQDIAAFLEARLGAGFLRFSTTETPLPITNNYGTPHTLGADRLAAACGAAAIFPRTNCLIIDAGTCIKYDLVTKEPAFEGGTIAPGLRMRLQAMHHFTAKLPLVELYAELPQMPPKSTETALLSGSAQAAVFEAEGFIRHYKAQFPDLRIIVTGGDADFFENHLKSEIFAAQNLVAVGLNAILAKLQA